MMSKNMTMGEQERIISTFMASVLPYSSDWNCIMNVGHEMHTMIMDGNWGLHEQFFSDEMHAMDRFEKACADRDIARATCSAIDFIEAIKHQNKHILKLAKNGN